jgi:hypothetical protein
MRKAEQVMLQQVETNSLNAGCHSHNAGEMECAKY